MYILTSIPIDSAVHPAIGQALMLLGATMDEVNTPQELPAIKDDAPAGVFLQDEASDPYGLGDDNLSSITVKTEDLQHSAPLIRLCEQLGVPYNAQYMGQHRMLMSRRYRP